MKALELTLYGPGSVGDYKRFTDAELAAEHWQAVWEAKCLSSDGYSPMPAMLEAATFYRFATVPHYDEPQP